MARLTPFRALRPAPPLAARLSSVPYDVVSTAEARLLAGDDPLSFLRVTRAEIELGDEVDPHDERVYLRGRANLERLKRDGSLIVEPEPALYLYRLRMGSHVQTGVAGCFSLDEYEAGTIKKHENTRRDKEDDRTRHVLTLRAQTGVVFLTHRATTEIDGLARRIAAAEPLYRFTAPDGVEHEVWIAAPGDRAGLVAAFASLPELYIADGHHRAASAWRARAAIRDGEAPFPAAPEAGDDQTFLAVAFPHDQAQILPYHRTVTTLGGRTAEQFLAELESRLEPVDDAPLPTARGRVSVYAGGKWRTFVLAPAAAGSVAAGLDCDRLQRQVLTPVLGIEDLRTDRRIDFVGGIRGTEELAGRVDSGRAAAAFALYPVTVDDLMAVSDADEIMPPKSTWFEPKLRDGLLVHEI